MTGWCKWADMPSVAGDPEMSDAAVDPDGPESWRRTRAHYELFVRRTIRWLSKDGEIWSYPRITFAAHWTAAKGEPGLQELPGTHARDTAALVTGCGSCEHGWSQQ